MAFLGVSFKGNPEQQELARLICENGKAIIFGIGNAGTGKTFCALATALELKDNKRYGKIIYGRNPINVGEDMGYLKGDIEDKYSPYMGPLHDNIEAIVNASSSKLNVNEVSHRIEATPIAFLRGRSFEDTILIIDEAQNLDLTALKTILTRVGKFSKVVLLGSMNQIDDAKQRRKPRCDFQRVIDKLQDLPYVGVVELTQSMRSPICAEVDRLLGELDD